MHTCPPNEETSRPPGDWIDLGKLPAVRLDAAICPARVCGVAHSQDAPRRCVGSRRLWRFRLALNERTRLDCIRSDADPTGNDLKSGAHNQSVDWDQRTALARPK